jgi:hypothetical protein
MSKPPSPIRRAVAWGAVILFAALVVAAALVPSDTRDRSPEVSGVLWSASDHGTRLMLYVTQEERSRSGTELDRLVTHHYTRYELVARRVGDGGIAVRQPLGDVEGARDVHTPAIVGVTGDIVWLWRDSLEGRRLPDLHVQLTASTLAVLAPATIEALPVEAAGFTVAPNLESLVARGRDARFYRIDAVKREISELDPALLPEYGASSRVEDRFSYLSPPGRARVITQPNWVMQQSFLTSTGLWYALLSESERVGVSRWPAGMDQPSGAVARSLYRVPYRLDDRRQPEIDPGALAPVGSERLIQGGFIVREAGRIWDVPAPSSSLVFARARLGGDEPWEVMRLSRDGRLLWRTSTGLSNPGMLLDLDTHLALLGEVAGAEAGERYERLVWIDQATGARSTLALESGEVR